MAHLADEYSEEKAMISLTRINRSSMILNCDLIEHIQATPDTVITLTNGHNYLVLESPQTVIDRVIEYRQRWFTFQTAELGQVEHG